MNRETKQCQNCKTSFTIEPEDFKFYEKISVPPPTWCPECKLMRKMIWRNERSLYRRTCNLCKKEILAIYPSKTLFPVYCHECWWSDKWDALDYGMEYNFSESFFSQYRKLENKVPRLALNNKNAINSEFVNQTGNIKNCYLVFGTAEAENCMYGRRFIRSKDSMDCFEVEDCELCYENVFSRKNYDVLYAYNTQNSLSSRFLSECRNCANCFLCVNLRNKQYHIGNAPYSKEEYYKEIKKYESLDINKTDSLLKELHDLKLRTPLKYRQDAQAINSSGDLLFNCRNIVSGINCHDAENCKNVTDVWFIKDSHDVFSTYGPIEMCYDTMAMGYGTYRAFFSFDSWPAVDAFYADHCYDSSHIFGCVNSRNKQYCILNRQYTKEEYEKLVPRIIEHMNQMPYTDKKGRVYRYGEFFPPELSPFSYNETIAQEYFPLTKEQAIEQGYSWKDPEPRNYQITLKTADIPDHIKDAPDSILNDIIQCAHHELGSSASKCNEQCTEAFRIIPQELDFLRKQNLPLPRLCPNCRHYQRIKQRNPLKLWHRKCMCAGAKSENQVYSNTIAHEHGENHCENNFETTYAPVRQEIVYCESCYLKEVV